MKFINTGKLNSLYAEFVKYHHDSEDFQAFVEQSQDNGKAFCLDIDEIQGYLEDLNDDAYNYLLECEDEDLEYYGEDYLKRVNFISRLLGAEGVTLEDIKKDRKPLYGVKIDNMTAAGCVLLYGNIKEAEQEGKGK